MNGITMDSVERFNKCLNHEPIDRVPVDYWGTNEINLKLREHFGFSTQEELLSRLDIDFRYIEGPKYIGPELIIRPDGSKEDHFGVPRKPVQYGKGKNTGTYSEVAEYPLEKAKTIDEIESYPKWPKADWFDYECIRQQAKQARETGKVVVFMGDRLNRCAQLKPGMYIRGVEQIFIDTLAAPEMAKAVFRRLTDFYAEYLRRTLEASENNIDLVFTGDDFGTQENMFVPIEVWRDQLKDGFKKFIDIGHEFGCKVAHHTCGCVIPLMMDFIECGLDIVNPLQPEVVGMDYEQIKREFGDKISFHGGISIQKTMPFGTPRDVSAEVKDRVEKLAHGGGYIFCTAHNLQTDTPIENIETLFSAYREFGIYS